MPNKKYILITVIVILIVAAAVVAGVLSRQGSSEYSFVKLSSGELYVGRLSLFPRPAIRTAYLFQATTNPDDADKPNFQLVPVSESLWAPKVIYLNPDQIIMRGRVGKDSDIAKTLQGK